VKLIIEELHGAACYLRKYPEATAAEVGEFVGKSKRTIERWSETAEWETACANLRVDFTGWRRNVQRNLERESGELVERAEQIYRELQKSGTPRHKLIPETARQLNIPIPRVRYWAKRNAWGDHDGDNQ